MRAAHARVFTAWAEAQPPQARARSGPRARATKDACLSQSDAVATLAVRDLGAARGFYEHALGLHVDALVGDSAIVFRAGGTRLLVYRSRFHGTNQATAVTWMVGDALEEIVRRLRARGVAFERYDLPGMEVKRDVHAAAGGLRLAWFMDPDGNVHCLVSA